MSENINWACKVCGRHSTLGGADRSCRTSILTTGTSNLTHGVHLDAVLIKCPNPDCGELDFEVNAYLGKPSFDRYKGEFKVLGSRPAGVGSFRFLPTTAQPLSKHTPAAVQADYEEACLITNLSPKSSATLARRALQGMIRDFWGIAKGTLADELKAIEDKCDPQLYKAMMALKSVGNIGAHPERDVNVIIDIDADEAAQLLELVHLLDGEWYVARAARQSRIQAVTALGAAKHLAKKAPAAMHPAPDGDGAA